MCWLLGAGVFIYLVATDNTNPVFITVVVGLLGIPGAIATDNARRERRKRRDSSTTTPPSVSSPSSSLSSGSSSVTPVEGDQ
jgi:hypothetical protein